MTQIKFRENYASEVITSQRQMLLWYNVIIAIFSTSGGILGWKAVQELPLVCCIVISVLSLAKLIQPHLLPSEKQLEKLEKIHTFYCKSYTELEELWYCVEGKRMGAAECEQKFYGLIVKEVEINPLVNELIKGKNKKLIKKAEDKSAIYFDQVFNT